MILRGYQTRLVKRAKAALKKRGNTLCIGATGMGKTVCLSALAGEMGGKTLVLQHRQELLEQNMNKFRKINPDWRCSIYDATTKSMAGDVVFASQQTLTRNLSSLPQFDHVIVDEVHHIVAPTYKRIIDECKSHNKKMLLSGFTATPERGDKKSLRQYFNNVADQITIRELVGLGFLVPPRAFVVDVGVSSRLERLGSQSSFGDQSAVADILDVRPINEEVVRHWKEKAGDRKTVVFCSTVKHAQDVADAFKQAGVSAECVHGDMGSGERRSILQNFDRGTTNVITNVAVLTEGFDSQPVGCVILLRLCSEKGPMIQMVGRGLRTVDPEIYPGVVKRDCIVLDFGTSLLTHGNLDQEDGLHEEKGEKEKGEAITKVCPTEYQPGMAYRFPDANGNIGCGCELPAQSRTCPVCGFVFQKDGFDPVREVELSELEILNSSPFRWFDLFGTDTCLMASGFGVWAGVFSPDHGDTWIALGKKSDDKKIYRLSVSGRLQAIAMADDMLRNYESETTARKYKRWLDEPATEKQLALLSKFGVLAHQDLFGYSGITKYAACCMANFYFNQREIEKAIGVI